MSLKDDFLEALRSVKRDFFKDYDYEEERSEEKLASFSESDDKMEDAPPPESTGFSTSPSAIAEGESTAEEEPAERASIMDTFQPEYHMVMDQEIAEPDREAPYSDPTPSNSGDPYFSAEESISAVPAASGEGEPVYGEYAEETPFAGRFSLDQFEDDESLSDSRTVISKNTVIRGALQTDDSVRMFGQILGDIDCRSNIMVAGKVRGNTSAANAYIINAQVDGNLLCDDVINVTDDAWILGNIRAQQADIDGKIKGNIEIRHSISIGSNSSIIGNISTDELEIRRGAFVNGQIMMYSPSRDVIDRFDRFDQ